MVESAETLRCGPENTIQIAWASSEFYFLSDFIVSVFSLLLFLFVRSTSQRSSHVFLICLVLLCHLLACLSSCVWVRLVVRACAYLSLCDVMFLIPILSLRAVVTRLRSSLWMSNQTAKSAQHVVVRIGSGCDIAIDTRGDSMTDEKDVSVSVNNEHSKWNVCRADVAPASANCPNLRRRDTDVMQDAVSMMRY